MTAGGALGGGDACTPLPGCSAQTAGSAGAIDLSTSYAGELCDTFDNDFDGVTDEGC